MLLFRNVENFLSRKNTRRRKKHLYEVETLESDIEKVWELFHKNSHQRSVVPPASQNATHMPPPASDTSTQVKLVKPSVLPFDASAGELRFWIKKFEAYYLALGMQQVITAGQHAYLLHCLESKLSLQLDGNITAKTSVLGANSCTSRLVEMFRKKFPLLLQRKKNLSDDPASRTGRASFS